MHELSITQSMLQIVLEQAEKAGADRIERINLNIGELSGFVEESVRFYFDFLAKNTAAEGASLSFNSVPAQVRCRNCNIVFQPGELNWSCPNCAQTSVEIIAGKELLVESIEVD